MRRQRAAIILTLAIVAWAGWLPLSALVAGAGTGGAFTTPVLAATYHVGSLICHQLPERSWHIGGVQVPVCARCLGLYAGAAFGALLGLAWWRRTGAGRSRAEERLRRVRWLLIGAGLPTGLLWLIEHLGNAPVDNVVRFAGAMPLGGAVAAIVVAWVAGVSFDAPRAATAID